MGRMKDVWQLKQDLIALDETYSSKPDKFFMDLYVSIRNCEKDLKNQIDSSEPDPPLPQDNYNYDPYGDSGL
jgi:hypothetical protein